MYEQVWRYLQSVADVFSLWRGSSFALWQALRIGQIALSLELSWSRPGGRSSVGELVSIQISVLPGSSPLGFSLGFSLGVRAVCRRPSSLLTWLPVWPPSPMPPAAPSLLLARSACWLHPAWGRRTGECWTYSHDSSSFWEPGPPAPG